MTRTAVVTGASSGIGAATARRLVADGYEVIAAARRVDRLEALAEETGVRAARLDVTDADSVAAFAASIGELDVLVNNAGGAFGADPVAKSDPADWQAMFDVNVMGTLRVTQALLPALSAGPGGTIVTITSTAAYVNYEGGGGYSAAKHAEHALTETLRLELAGVPVRVMEIEPGMVKTDEFAVKRYGGDAEAAAKVYADVDKPLTAEDVADCIGLVVGLPPHVNVDQMVLRPLAQAAQHKVFRGKLFR
jgi:NADP-dependent 3-hydroxy acid dehydrogenase YdfG